MRPQAAPGLAPGLAPERAQWARPPSNTRAAEAVVQSVLGEGVLSSAQLYNSRVLSSHLSEGVSE